MKKTVSVFLRLLLLLVAAGLTPVAQAGGIALGATRVIYPQGSKQTSLPIINSSDSNVFLIQSWVANADGSRSTDFIVTPPLFVIQPKKENILRIMYVGPSLPTDRESVFYLNSKAIPSVDKNKLTSNSLQIATQSVIKLFIRPKDLAEGATHAPATLRCSTTMPSRAITIFTPPLAPARTNSITSRKMRGLMARYWMKIILVTTYRKVIRIRVLAKAAPPAWNTMGRRVMPTLATT